MASRKHSRVTATEARIHFGEMMRRAEDGETLLVERAGQPMAVIISIEEYDRLTEPSQYRTGDNEAEKPEWQRLVEETGNQFREDLKGKKIDWDKIIDEMRNERDEDLFESLR